LELGVLDHEEYTRLQPWHNYAIKNNLNETIGEIVPVFHLQRANDREHILGKTLST
jgi:hypothetical protein